MSQLLESEALRFWAQVIQSSDITVCWEWVGAKNGWRLEKRYGRFRRNRPHCRRHSLQAVVYAHRFAYCLGNGMVNPESLPKDMVVRHKCDNPLCCNPEHLELGTQLDNINDTRSRRKKTGETKFEDIPV